MRRSKRTLAFLCLSWLLAGVACVRSHVLGGVDSEHADAAAEPPEVGDEALAERAPTDATDATDGGEPPITCDAATAGGPWQVLGELLGATTRSSFAPSIALGDGDQPVVAWFQANQVFTWAWQEAGCDGAWRELGPPVDGGFPALVSDDRGIVRAYLRLNGAEVLVERWNGTAFVQVGPRIDDMGAARAFAPAVAVDHGGNPVVAWDTDAAGANVQVARWTGSEWQALTGAKGVPDGLVYSNAYVFNPISLALTADGTPVVAWAGAARATRAAQHTGGTTWKKLGLPLNTFEKGMEFSGPVVRVDPSGAMFLASYGAPPTTDHALVYSFAGDGWMPLGDGTWAGGQDFDLNLDATGAPCLVSTRRGFNDVGSLVMYRRSGTVWEQTPTPPVDAIRGVRTPHFVFDKRGRIVMAWVEPVLDDVRGVIRVARTIR